MSKTQRTLALVMMQASVGKIYKLELGKCEQVELPAFEAVSKLKHHLNLSGIKTLRILQ